MFGWKTWVLVSILLLVLVVPTQAESRRWVTEKVIGNPEAEITLTFWVVTAHSHQSAWEERNRVQTELYEQWAIRNPNVKIEMELLVGPIHEWSVRLLEMAKAGRGPDISSVDSYFVPWFILEGVMEPITEFLTKEDIDDFFPFVRNVITGPDDEVYAYWRNTDCRALYYRTDLVPEPPRTLDELIEIASRVSEEHGVSGYLFNGGRWEATTFDNLAFFWAQGGRLVDEEGRPIFNEGENRTYMLNVLEFLKRTVDSGASPIRVVDIMEYDDFVATAMADDVAMFLGGNWQVEQLRDMLPPEEFEKWAVAPIPQLREDLYSTGTGGWTFGVFTDDPVKKVEAFRFIHENYGRPEAMFQTTKAAGYLPTRASVYEDYHHFAVDPWQQIWSEMLVHGQARPGFPIYPTISEQLQIAIGNILTGVMTPEQALDEAWEYVLDAYEDIVGS